MAEAVRIELTRPVKVITVFKTDKHANLAHLRYYEFKIGWPAWFRPMNSRINNPV